MARKLIVNLLSTVTVLLVIFALFHYSFGKRGSGSRQFNCRKCNTICGKGKGHFWGGMKKYCLRCAVLCDNPKASKDPWLKISMVKKQIRNGTLIDMLTLDKKMEEPTAKGPNKGQEGRWEPPTYGEPPPNYPGSAMAWWGRR